MDNLSLIPVGFSQAIIPNSGLCDPSKSDLTLVETLDRLRRIQEAAITLKDAFNTAVQQAPNAYMMVGGVMQILTGNLPAITIGALMILLGGKNMYDSGSFSSDTDDDSLLNHAEAGIKMINILDERNKKSIQSIATSIGKLESEFQNIAFELEDVRQIASQGDKEIEVAKNQAAKQFDLAAEVQQQALKALKNAQESLEKGTSKLQEIKKNIEAIRAKATNPSENEEQKLQRVDEYKILSNDALETFDKSQEILIRSNQELMTSMSLFSEAEKCRFEAMRTILMAGFVAKMRFSEIQSRAKHDLEMDIVQTELDETKGKLEDIKQDQEAKESIVRQVEKDLAAIKKNSTYQVVKIVIAGTVGAWLLGPIGVPPATIFAWYVQNMGVSRKKDVMIGDFSESDSSEQHINFCYNPNSTGYRNWMLGKSSESVGTLELIADHQLILKCSVDFRQKGNAIEENDRKEIEYQIRALTIAKPEFRSKALDLLDRLERTAIFRNKHTPPGRFVTTLSFKKLKRELMESTPLKKPVDADFSGTNFNFRYNSTTSLYRSGPSQTEGILYVYLEQFLFSCQVNFKNKAAPISDGDIQELVNVIKHRVMAEPKLADQALTLLSNLSEASIPRLGHRHSGYFISPLDSRRYLEPLTREIQELKKTS